MVYCLEHDIDIKRNTEKRKYIWNNKERIYIPDFVVNSRLIEIKGYSSQQWLAKLSANPDVSVLYENDIYPIINYVKSKYGNDFVSLYENRG